MVIPSIAAIAAGLGVVAVLLYRLHALFRQPADEIAEEDGCTEWQLDEDTYFCYTPTSERVVEIRRRLEVKDEQRRAEKEDCGNYK